MTPDSIVQSIVVHPSTHFETVAAAALASAVAIAQADVKAEPWQQWLEGSFTKSVRRAKKRSDLERVRGLELTQTEIRLGNAVAIAFEPARYDSSPAAISRLQVSGLDLLPESAGFDQAGAETPRIEINADVAMSTGKTAAQVAHALAAWVLAVDPARRSRWLLNPGLSLANVDFEVEPVGWSSTIIIRDNGLTEIEPGTPTARVNAGAPLD